MKKLVKIVLVSVLSLVAFVLVYLAAAFLLPHVTVEKERNTSSDVTVYLLTNGTHTDIVVPAKTPVKDWTQQLKFEHTKYVDSSYTWIGIGWGDKGFYLEIPTWDDLTPRIAFRAAFGLGTTAIHTTYFQHMKEGPDCVSTTMSTEQYLSLVKYIQQSFLTDGDGNVLNIQTDAVYGSNDAFYEAKGRYSIFHTCNTWTNNALKSSGQRACMWTAFDKGIFYQYRK